MKEIFSKIFVGVLILVVAGSTTSIAQDPQASEIVEALKPKQPLTRTFRKVDMRKELLDRGIRIDEPLPPDVPRQEYMLTIGFEFDSDTLTPEGRQTVNVLAQALGNDKLGVTLFQIAGHTDASGDAAYNMDLSKRRAQTVAVHLIRDYGISVHHLTAVGYGEMQPANAANPYGAENRRVVVISADSILEKLAN